jgi:ABC-type dipeptide/oligopeptide/nickel transport system permease component
MGVLLLGAVLIVLGNLIADIVYGVLDPRISYA